MKQTAINNIVSTLGSSINPVLSKQLVDEFTEVEKSFIQKKWKYTELDGGRVCEVAARILYAHDSGIVNLTKPVDECLAYIESNSVPHHSINHQSMIHLDRVIKAVYKLRSQRGGVHVSPKFTADHFDSRLILENCRWIFGEIVRTFSNMNSSEVENLIDNLPHFTVAQLF